MEQHRKVEVENARLVEQFKEEEMNAGTIEHSLKVGEGGVCSQHGSCVMAQYGLLFLTLFLLL